MREALGQQKTSAPPEGICALPVPVQRRSQSMKMPLIALLVAATAVIAGCGGGDDSNSTPSTPTPVNSKLLTNIAVPNATSPAFSFDIGYTEAGRYYLA